MSRGVRFFPLPPHPEPGPPLALGTSALLCGRVVVRAAREARTAPRDQDGRVQAKDSMWLAGAECCAMVPRGPPRGPEQALVQTRFIRKVVLSLMLLRRQETVEYLR